MNNKKMAVYAISHKGITALEELKVSLTGASEEITMLSEVLLNVVDDLEDGLGIYYKEILELTRKVLLTLQTAKEGEDSIDVLANVLIPGQINRIEELINMGLGDEDDEPPQKKLVLRR